MTLRPKTPSSWRRYVRGCSVCLFVLIGAQVAQAIVVLQVGEAGGVAPFPHRNGRQIARNSAGLWFVAYQAQTEQGTATYLATSRSAEPGFPGDFHAAISLVSSGGSGVLASGGGEVRLANIAIDRLDTLHLIWESSEPQRVWYSRCDVSVADVVKHVKRKESWTGLNGSSEAVSVGDPTCDAYLGDTTLGPSGDLWIAYSEAVEVEPGYSYPVAMFAAQRRVPLGDQGYELWISLISGDRATRRRMADPGPNQRPVVDLDEEGALHVVHSGPRSRHLYYHRYPEFSSQFEQAGDLTTTLPYPLWHGTSCSAYSVVGWGERALVAFERTGHIPLYAYFDGTSWRYESLNATEEEYRNPILVRDYQGSAWVFWANLSRGHTFFARWLGDRFSSPYISRTVIDGLDDGDMATDTRPTLSAHHTVQRQVAEGAPIGLALAGSSPARPVYFDQMGVVDLKVEPGRKVLFLDMAEIRSMEGLVRSFHPMKKHTANPVLRTGPPGSWDSGRAHAYGAVHFDGERFQMWYSGWSRPDSAVLPGTNGHHVGYAESLDGLHWIKPSLGQYAINGSKDNNIVDLGEGEGHAYMPMVFYDDRETDPARRYKMIVEQRRGNMLHFSPDGIRWSEGDRVRDDRWSDQRSLFFDWLEADPQRRWKVYSHGGARPPVGLRKICRDWSADLINWTPDPRNPVAHPRASTAAEYHLISVWIDAGMYLGLVDAWQHTHVQPQYLMASRDGVNLVEVFDGRAAIELGGPGSWDAGWIAPVTAPVIVGDEMWVYYSGGPVSIGGHVEEFYELPMQTGLATIRRDGFVSLRVEPGAGDGGFTTIPLQPQGSDLALELNADGLIPQGIGTIRVDLLVDGQVLAKSMPVTISGVRIPVLWPEGDRLPLPETGLLRLRFRLEGKALLYSFSFR